MNTKAYDRVGLSRLNSLSLLGAFVFLTIAGSSLGFCQTPAKSSPNQPIKKEKETLSAGYLSKSPPAGLRFAAPPRPPVAYLPPLPISQDPQPVFSPEYASPNAEVPIHTGPSPPPPPPVVTSVGVTELTSMFTKTAKIPQDLPTQTVVNPQMLVKFFQRKNPSEVRFILPDPISFRAPIQAEKISSSATYEVK